MEIYVFHETGRGRSDRKRLGAQFIAARTTQDGRARVGHRPDPGAGRHRLYAPANRARDLLRRDLDFDGGFAISHGIAFLRWTSPLLYGKNIGLIVNR